MSLGQVVVLFQFTIFRVNVCRNLQNFHVDFSQTLISIMHDKFNSDLLRSQDIKVNIIFTRSRSILQQSYSMLFQMVGYFLSCQTCTPSKQAYIHRYVDTQFNMLPWEPIDYFIHFFTLVNDGHSAADAFLMLNR